MQKVKQVIIFRHDLLKTLRKGKIAAQVAHASIGALLKLGKSGVYFNDDMTTNHYEIVFDYNIDSVLDLWLNGIFTKICVMVENEEELLKLYKEISKTDH